ncbi:hypothetical protein ERX46_04345 [Brumimicrobium glaciale]|jgi:predicted RNase H-like nuclease|uniref:Uncharacterized protein n=1 Tax=Brumimicrobium glaciale TaxID=200475 RepID=A0A4Q4KNL9_9FLAO|nr:hypothetical protein [Brumimicrobium glaciale]RYM34610.1 hypothetical protein ERX46_04345 [Brumimicrobium glaciale]
MMNRYVIALNRLNIAKEQLTKHHNQGIESKLTIFEVAQLMDVVRKYPSQKIEHDDLFTCGFSKN